MYYIIYKTTNLLNGRYYIGSHRTVDLDDDYLGSGKAILRAIKKHGKENFRKEVLFMALNEEALDLIEEQLVVTIHQDPLSYNLIPGGGRPPLMTIETAKKAMATKRARGTQTRPPARYGEDHHNHKGYRWITNGLEDKTFRDSEIPEGWRLGRTNGVNGTRDETGRYI